MTINGAFGAYIMLLMDSYHVVVQQFAMEAMRYRNRWPIDR